jgi:hypothetical protein
MHEIGWYLDGKSAMREELDKEAKIKTKIESQIY